MRVVICGAGQVGYGIAEKLAAEQNDVSVIDSSPRLINVASAAGRLRGSLEKTSALCSDELTVEALSALMRQFVRDAEAGDHVERGYSSC